MNNKFNPYISLLLNRGQYKKVITILFIVFITSCKVSAPVKQTSSAGPAGTNTINTTEADKAWDINLLNT